MIDLYFWTTPNAYKVLIFLEEAGVPYRLLPVNISRGDQFSSEFLAISPNSRIPVIVDGEPSDRGNSLAVFESGAILQYLARKTDRFYGPDERSRLEVEQWLFWQMAGLGPMAGQNHHFNYYAPEPLPYAIRRYGDEVGRLYGVLENRLTGRDFVVGKSYSIADMACYPWMLLHERGKQEISQFPRIAEWIERIRARPAVMRAYLKGKAMNETPVVTDENSKKILFGQTARVFQRLSQSEN